MAIAAAQYVRMSTDQQPLSIGTQKAAIAVYAAEHGLDITHTYADEGRSGLSLAGRDGMQKLLKDVMEPDRSWQVVLVLDVSRWGRFQDVDESAYYEYHCRKHGARVIYVAERFRDSESLVDSLMKQLKRVAAAETSRELGVKCRAGQIHAIKLGFASGVLPCIGYRREAVSLDGSKTRLLEAGERKPAMTDRVRWVLGPSTEVDTVRRIFGEYTSGVAIRRITAKLNDEGILDRGATRFTPAKIHALLRNEVVTGTFSWGKRTTRAARGTFIEPLLEPVRNTTMVPGIVERAAWENAQARLRASVGMKNHGYLPEVLVDKLRAVLRDTPGLVVCEFGRYGLPGAHAYRRHFGCMTQAFAAAGRPRNSRTAEHIERNMAARQVGKRFVADVFDLLQAAGVSSVLDLRRHLLHLGSVEVKVRIACELPSTLAPRWFVVHAHESRDFGRWLLFVRLNSDRCTGKDFFLLPPSIYATFTGKINSANLPKLEPFRIDSAQALINALVGTAGHPEGEAFLRGPTTPLGSRMHDATPLGS